MAGEARCSPRGQILLSWVLEIERQSQTNSPFVYCCRKTSNIALGSRVGWVVTDCYLLAGWVRDSQDLPAIVGWTMVGVGMDAWQRVVDETLEYFWMKLAGTPSLALYVSAWLPRAFTRMFLYYFRATSKASVRYDRMMERHLSNTEEISTPNVPTSASPHF